uniref:Uncharacterized protein n=1 Tax=Salix viminalis TaxID=40686 RepID=A0A6N2NBW8_SALVM
MAMILETLMTGDDELLDALDDYDDGFENVFESEDSGFDYEFIDEDEKHNEFDGYGENGELWTADASFDGSGRAGRLQGTVVF